MKTLLSLCLSLCFMCFGCTKIDKEGIDGEKSLIMIQYSKTKEFEKITNTSTDILLDKAAVTNIPNNKGENIKALTIPYNTSEDKMKFALVYTTSENEFNSSNSKTIIIEIVNSNLKPVLNSIKSGNFDGNINIYNLEEQLVYQVNYKQNKVMPIENRLDYFIKKREEECSVDGVGACAGQKFESAGVIEKSVCLVGIVECMAIYAADCWIENCL